MILITIYTIHFMMNQTPNLANSFNPQPKPAPKNKKTPKSIKKGGKKGRASLDAVEQMKQGFASVGIVECEGRLEGCWHNNALSFAHASKRRKLTPEELTQAALL